MNSRLRVANSMSREAYLRHIGQLPPEPVDPPAPRKPRSYPEQALQIACVEVLVRHVPGIEQGGPFWSALNPIPAKSKAAAGLSKAMGMRAGVPDIVLVHGGKALFVELKRPDGKGRVDPKQREAMAAIEANGGAVEVCRSVPDFIAILRRWDIPCRAIA